MFVACCIWNQVAVELAIDVMASMAALPQTIVQPGFLHNWQSRLGLVLHILLSGFSGVGQGTLQSVLEGGGGLYQLRPAPPSWSFEGGSLRMQMPSFRGNVLGRTLSLYLSSSRDDMTRKSAWENGYLYSTCSLGMWTLKPC